MMFSYKLLLKKINQFKSIISILALLLLVTVFYSCKKLLDTTEDANDNPIVTIVRPTQQQIINEPIQIVVEIQHGGAISYVDFYVDSVQIGRDSTAPYSIFWNSGFWSDGLTHILKAIAIDNSGRSDCSAPVSVTVSTSVSIPKIVRPIDGEFIETSPVIFSWNSIPTVTNYYIEIRESPSSLPISYTTSDTSLQWTGSHPSIYAWRVRGENALGRFTAWSPYTKFQTTATFSKIYSASEGGAIVAAKELSTGGYIVTGYKFNNGSMDARTIKLDKKGAIVWENTHSFIPNNIIETFDHNYIIVGVTAGGDAVVLSMNSQGSDVWAKYYKPYRYQAFNNIILNADGTFYAVGEADLDPVGRMSRPTYGWLVKLSSIGDTLWTRLYKSNDECSIENLAQHVNGFLVLQGAAIHMKDTLNPGPPVPWLSSVNQNGDIQWHMEPENSIASMAVNSTAGIILAGTKKNSDNYSNIWIEKKQMDGNTVWSAAYGEPSANYTTYAIPMLGGGYAAAGGVHVLGQQEQCFLMAVDENGNQQWFKKYGNAGSGRNIVQTFDKGFLVGGQIISSSDQMWLIKTDCLGRIKYDD